jgi:hypothetical protein
LGSRRVLAYDERCEKLPPVLKAATQSGHASAKSDKLLRNWRGETSVR